MNFYKRTRLPELVATQVKKAQKRNPRDYLV